MIITGKEKGKKKIFQDRRLNFLCRLVGNATIAALKIGKKSVAMSPPDTRVVKSLTMCSDIPAVIPRLRGSELMLVEGALKRISEGKNFGCLFEEVGSSRGSS